MYCWIVTPFENHNNNFICSETLRLAVKFSKNVIHHIKEIFDFPKSLRVVSLVG
jgi:hypothetical protein